MKIRPSMCARTLAAGLLACALCGGLVIAQECTDYSNYIHVTRSLPYAARFVAESGDFAYLSSRQVVDVSLPGDPMVIGDFEGRNGEVRGLRVVADRLYAIYTAGATGAFNGLVVYDLSDPAAPALLGAAETPGIATQVRVAGDLVFVRNDEGMIHIVDVVDPGAPALRGNYGGAWLTGFDVMGDLLYAVDTSRDDVVEVSVADPDLPAVVRRLAWAGVTDFQFANGFGYVYQGGVYTVYDFTPPGPTLIGPLPVIDRPVTMSDGRAYAFGLPFVAYDMSDPLSPVALFGAPFVINAGFTRGDWILGGISESFVSIDASSAATAPAPTATLDLDSSPTGMAVLGDHVVILQRMGVDVIDASVCGAPVKLATYPMFADNTGYAVADDHLFVLVRGAGAGTTGLHAVNLSDPALPTQAAEIQLDGDVQGLVAFGSYLYAGAMGAIVVIDVGDPTAPVEVTRLAGRMFGPPAVVYGNFLMSGLWGELRIFDLSDPSAPATLVSTMVGYEILDLVAADDLLFVQHAGGVDIYDIANPASGTPPLSRIEVPGTVDAMAAAGGYLYVEGHSIHVVDLADPVAPAFVGSLGYTVDRLDDLVAVGDCLYYPQYLSPDRGRLNVTHLQCGESEPVAEVVIDVKPGSLNNPINCRSNHGMIPVAILTTATFDALSVDHTTVRFGPGEAGEAHRSNCPDNNGKGKHRDCSEDVRRHEEDVDCDGDMDLMFHFLVSEADIACGDKTVTLTGMTWDGVAFSAEDNIDTRPKCDSDKSYGGDDDDGRYRNCDKVPAGATDDDGPAVTLAPNPFNPKTVVSFRLLQAGRVRAAVYDLAGRRISVLADGDLSGGEHSLVWLGRDTAGRAAPSGVYFVRVEGPGVNASLRAVLLR